MKIKRAITGEFCVVFLSSYHADRWEWLFGTLLGMIRVCYGQYDNAYMWG